MVPRLAPWCAVLLPGDARAPALAAGALAGDGGLRTSYTRHGDDRLAGALAWLLDRVCQVTAPDFSAGRGAAPRPGRRWPLVVGDMAGAPPGPANWPPTPPGASRSATRDAIGVLVIGDGGQDRLPHDVSALAADLACRIGLALNRAAFDAGRAELDPARLVGHKS